MILSVFMLYVLHAFSFVLIKIVLLCWLCVLPSTIQCLNKVTISNQYIALINDKYLAHAPLNDFSLTYVILLNYPPHS